MKIIPDYPISIATAYVIIVFGLLWLVASVIALILQDNYWSFFCGTSAVFEFCYVWWRAKTRGVER